MSCCKDGKNGGERRGVAPGGAGIENPRATAQRLPRGWNINRATFTGTTPVAGGFVANAAYDRARRALPVKYSLSPSPPVGFRRSRRSRSPGPGRFISCHGRKRIARTSVIEESLRASLEFTDRAFLVNSYANCEP